MRFLLKSLCSLLIILTLTSGGFKDYFLILDTKQYSKLATKGDKEVLKRSIVFDELVKPSENPHLINDEKVKTQQFAYLLKKRKSVEIEEFLKQHDRSLPIHSFYEGFNYFMLGEYKLASQALEKYEGTSVTYYKYLLLGDCLYESKGHTAIDELIILYQKAMDNSLNSTEKEIVNNRIKFIVFRK